MCTLEFIVQLRVTVSVYLLRPDAIVGIYHFELAKKLRKINNVVEAEYVSNMKHEAKVRLEVDVWLTDMMKSASRS